MLEYTEENLKKIIKESKTYNEVLIKFNRNSSSDSYKVLKKRIKEWNIDVSHFLNKKQNIEKMFNDGRLIKKCNDEIFIENSSVSRHTTKNRILKDNLITYVCIECGQDEFWKGKKISLILDHINGIRNDNRLENLRFLCPNCNSSLDTHCKGEAGLISEEEKEIKIREKKRLINKYGNRVDYRINQKEENFINIHKPRIDKIITSDINFSKFGWVKKVSELIEIPSQKVNEWMKKYMFDFYNDKCFKKTKINDERVNIHK